MNFFFTASFANGPDFEPENGIGCTHGNGGEAYDKQVMSRQNSIQIRQASKSVHLFGRRQAYSGARESTPAIRAEQVSPNTIEAPLQPSLPVTVSSTMCLLVLHVGKADVGINGEASVVWP